MSLFIRFHAKLSSDLREILDYYENEASRQIGDDFYHELMGQLEIVAANPAYFDGVRRVNLKRFPYHFLYRIRPESVWIFVLRHNSRNPSYGTRRF